MTEFDFLYVLERYGADTALVALFVVLCVWLLKKTLLKNHVHTPVVAFLPFILGVVLFFVLQIALHPSWEYLSQNAAFIVQRGFVVGCVASLDKAIISHFLGAKPLPDRASVVRAVLQGFVAEEQLDELSVAVADCVSEACTEEDAALVAAVLQEYASEAYAESDLHTLAQIIVRTLKTTAA